jgi:poly(hydroxyalkanoate) granule-associated protein
MTEIDVSVVEEEVKERESRFFFDAARNVFLASIGAVALAQDELEELVEKLVERGELAERDGRKVVKDLLDSRKQKTERSRSEMGDDLERRIESVLHRLNVPTKRDVDELSRKLTILSEKVDDLKKS